MKINKLSELSKTSMSDPPQKPVPLVSLILHTRDRKCYFSCFFYTNIENKILHCSYASVPGCVEYAEQATNGFSLAKKLPKRERCEKAKKMGE